METIKTSISNLYEVRAQLSGLFKFKQGEKEGDEPTREVIILGLINEKGVPESTKRLINKTLRVINPELEDIDKQRQAMYADTSDGATPEVKKAKDDSLLSDSIEFITEKIDFKKIEDLSLSYDYKTTYELLFTNY